MFTFSRSELHQYPTLLIRANFPACSMPLVRLRLHIVLRISRRMNSDVKEFIHANVPRFLANTPARRDKRDTKLMGKLLFGGINYPYCWNLYCNVDARTAWKRARIFTHLGARALILMRMRGAELDSAARHKDEHSNLTISFEKIRCVSRLEIRITSDSTRYSKTS